MLKGTINGLILSVILWLLLIQGCSCVLDTLDRVMDEPPLSDEEIWRAGVGEGNL